MITGHRAQFEARCRSRGYTLDEVRACIVAEDGDAITVDETHPAYPRTPRPGFEPKPVPPPQPPEPPPLPPITDRIASFAKSAVKHVATGARLCTQEEIDARYAICQACEWFSNGACGQCGCPLVREKQYISKLSWASERCPVGKWGPIA